MCAFALFHNIDPSLGRVEYSLFSDQTLMEMLFEGFDDETKKQYQDDDGVYRDVCGWSCIKCDDDERVIKIEIYPDNVSGLVELCYVPPKMKVFRIVPFGTGKLTGSVDLAQLPDGIYVFSLSDNQLTGEIDLTRLPERMHGLSLEKNQLSGEIDLSNLPDEIDYLNLESNRLTGEIDLKQLPNNMCELHLNNNQLTGSVDLTHLPEKTRQLFLNNNQFSGPFIAKSLPLLINLIDASRNKFDTIAVVSRRANFIINLRESGVTSVVDEEGKTGKSGVLL